MGSRVAVRVAGFQATLAGTSCDAASRSSKFAPVTVAGASASLKVAVTIVPTTTAVAPLAGLVAVTVGGVRSGAARRRS